MTRRPLLPRLHVIVGDAQVAGDAELERLRPVLAAGGSRLALHLRARALAGRRLFEVAEWLVAAAGPAGALVVVNDRVDVALAAGADGVHLREDSLPVADARRVAVASGAAGEGGPAGEVFLIGKSVHLETVDLPRPAEQADGQPDTRAALADQAAANDDARAALPDYHVLGAVHRTRSHPGRRPIGLDALERTARSSPVPVLAIGGITPRRVRPVLDRGAHGVVVLSGVWRAADPAGSVGRYLQALQ